MRDLGRLLMIAGGTLLFIGVLVRWTPLGRLPGDIFVRRGNFTLYFPLVTSILISIVLTVLFWLFSRLR